VAERARKQADHDRVKLPFAERVGLQLVVVSPDEIDRLERELKRAEQASLKAATVRSKMPAGSSSARVTTANAKWARAAEYRDLIARQLADAREALEVGRG
jgi:hypothetical protein